MNRTLKTFILQRSLFYDRRVPTNLSANPKDVKVEVNESANITYKASVQLRSNVQLYFNHSDYIDIPSRIELAQSTGEGLLELTGRKPVSDLYLDITECRSDNATECELDINDAYVGVSVIRSHTIDVLTVVVGWMYFVAWSISFYPQIILNFQRKSVAGLNFDFLCLNIIGFTAYTLYNVLMYWDHAVQKEYLKEHPRSPIPVLLNDVVFAIHALTACIITAAQCFFLERDHQRVSKICMGLSTILILFGAGSGIVALLKLITILQFIQCFSYIKMVVTLSKYFPQMLFNFRRKSTVGWSIGNILLDFTGGTLDIVQMVLQSYNVDNWSAFYGNPVKGVTVVHAEYDGIENPEAPQSPSAPDYGATDQPILENEEQRH
ncbi:unnamed protein product [Cylicocyclus nassatus]|uniref:Cystinosin n=1 Tax=Cylicocyclus nassatus TaxID=53992 RepID=A0AA36MGM9_CYLNA|nr:unnamed protein product [Cylicocyclus nassatus]